MLKRILKIGYRRAFYWAFYNANDRTIERSNNIKRIIGGMIVGDDHFVVLSKLGKNGGELCMYCFSAIIGSYADRYHGREKMKKRKY